MKNKVVVKPIEDIRSKNMNDFPLCNVDFSFRYIEGDEGQLELAKCYMSGVRYLLDVSFHALADVSGYLEINSLVKQENGLIKIKGVLYNGE